MSPARMATVLLQRALADAAAAFSFVHDVGGIQRGQVHHFGDGGAGDYVLGARVGAKLGAQQRHHGAEAVAAGCGEVGDFVGEELFAA